MINDNCDVVGCLKRATTEIEINEDEIQYVCDKHITGIVVRTKPNEFETHIYEEKLALTQKEYESHVRDEIENFIMWFWSNDNDRVRPLKALEEYDKENIYNEVIENGI